MARTVLSSRDTLKCSRLLTAVLSLVKLPPYFDLWILAAAGRVQRHFKVVEVAYCYPGVGEAFVRETSRS